MANPIVLQGRDRATYTTASAELSLLYLVKRLHNQRNIPLANSHTGVFDLKNYIFFLIRLFYFYTQNNLTKFCKLDGIAEKVAQDLSDSQLILEGCLSTLAHAHPPLSFRQNEIEIEIESTSRVVDI